MKTKTTPPGKHQIVEVAPGVFRTGYAGHVTLSQKRRRLRIIYDTGKVDYFLPEQIISRKDVVQQPPPVASTAAESPPPHESAAPSRLTVEDPP